MLYASQAAAGTCADKYGCAVIGSNEYRKQIIAQNETFVNTYTDTKDKVVSPYTTSTPHLFLDANSMMS